jgi:hypothetical protein
VEGARLEKNRLLIEVPYHEENEFVQRQIRLKIK